jgi:hypothetical protein
MLRRLKMTDTMIGVGINATVNYIWKPLAWILGMTGTLPTMYVCPEQPCTIYQMFVSPDECIILQTVDGENSRIKGACIKADGKLTITEDNKIYTWSYKENGSLFELTDVQTKKTIKLVRSSKE